MPLLQMLIIPRRNVMTNQLRKELYAQCLNREFDKLLPTLRQISVEEMDYSLLQLTLQQSCRWGHIECIDFIWYKYVKRHNSMLIEPKTLCSIGQIALGEGKSFIASDLLGYYKGIYGKGWHDLRPGEFVKWEYELLRIKIEMFAKTALNRSFSEKWKVFLQDIDNALPASCEYNYKDFPHLVKSYETDQSMTSGKISMLNYLFQDKDISVTNKTTLPLLLNIILLQNEFALDTRLNLFKRFFTTHPSLPILDSIEIMIHECDGYRICELLDFVSSLQSNNLTKLIPSHIKNKIKKKLQQSTLEYKLNQYFY
uniref:Pet122p n=1 Tax=Monosporozyma servazzii TaxID=27293 RepID=O13376_MONSE|nr:Pet122p [Kazachstania servazzii]